MMEVPLLLPHGMAATTTSGRSPIGVRLMHVGAHPPPAHELLPANNTIGHL
jgi:hypothetical protein